MRVYAGMRSVLSLGVQAVPKLVAGLALDAVPGVVTLSFFNDFDTWAPTLATLVANNAPDSVGGTNGDTMTDDPTAGNHAISYSGVNVVAGNSYTFEVLLKAGNLATVVYLGLFDGVTHSAFIDLSTGVVGATSNVISVASSNAGLLNGFWRITFKWVANSTGSVNIGIFQTNLGSVSYAGFGVATIIIDTARVTRP